MPEDNNTPTLPPEVLDAFESATAAHEPTLYAKPTGNPHSFQEMAHDVNSISGDQHSDEPPSFNDRQPEPARTFTGTIDAMRSPEASFQPLVEEAEKPQPLPFNTDVAVAELELPTAAPLVHQPSSELLSQIEQSSNQIAEFIKANKVPVIAFSVVLGSLPPLAFALALLNTIHAIPLLEPFCELVGLGVTGRFIYQHLLYAGDRQSLVENLEDFKARVVS